MEVTCDPRVYSGAARRTHSGDKLCDRVSDDFEWTPRRFAGFLRWPAFDELGARVHLCFRAETHKHVPSGIYVVEQRLLLVIQAPDRPRYGRWFGNVENSIAWIICEAIRRVSPPQKRCASLSL